MKVSAEFEPNPAQMAELFWRMGSDEQAVFFEELQGLAGSHLLMMQGLAIRQECENSNNEHALEAFQSLFASAYKYMW